MAKVVLLSLVAMLFASHAFASSTLQIFEPGNYSNNCFHVDDSPPKPLLICTPIDVNAKFPVILFFPGTCLQNSYYTQLFKYIASHGYIVVSPQLYSCKPLPVCGETEVDYAAGVVNWLPSSDSGLQSLLPPGVEIDLYNNLYISGHSRGAKTAFALALGKVETLKLKFSALVGVDPVAGVNKHCRTGPEILNFHSNSLNLKIPVTVIGSGLGDQKSILHCPACAPKGVNHVDFFDESKPPKGHFVTADFGHLDILDDGLPFEVTFLCKACEDPTLKDQLRRTVGGIIVGFMEYLESQSDDFMTIIVNKGTDAPVTLEPPPVYINESMGETRDSMPVLDYEKLKEFNGCFWERFCTGISFSLGCFV